MKMKFAAGLASAAVATTLFAPAAFALDEDSATAATEQATTTTAPAVDPEFSVAPTSEPTSDEAADAAESAEATESTEAEETTAPEAKPEKPAKPTLEEQKQKADLTTQRLDNAQKGIGAAKDIMDILGHIGGIFGLGGK
ncbi:MAG: hypothetical protein Q4E11_03815 [Corynebacterium sp.]|uniref:hypothetical protein n=1 Tax=Corynebacterium sp. TaxID=1720 RepID=UPI0026DB5A1C|nr:hypothetical protein [Corynebacterium sp.]MDO5029697.1 hypothetical protein [Corynebacterium sp.]